MRAFRGGRDEPGAALGMERGPGHGTGEDRPGAPPGAVFTAEVGEGLRAVNGPPGHGRPYGGPREEAHGGAPGGARTPHARCYEALGRVMAAMSGEAEVLEACRDLAWWQGNDQSWHLEWREGPYASEVATLLAERMGEPAGPLGAPDGPATASSASLEVMGVSIVLRAIDPSGMERLRDRPGLWRLSAALDGTAGGAAGGRDRGASGRGASRQHWEELLGG
ncbi:hypothetical protein [Microbispora sp. NPDC049125]|uniref:hypothetical protein n=1 Tax=Microbispora sp. NPDC049125 TaxID=3154929 RepID=UPI0034666E46